MFDIPTTSSFILFLITNWALASWYEQRVKENNGILYSSTFLKKLGLYGTLTQKNNSSIQKETHQEKNTQTLQISLLPYCKRTHYYSAFATDILSTAIMHKIFSIKNKLFA